MEGLVRTWKETDQAGGTHQLETVEGGCCQNTERKRPSGRHLLPEDSRGGLIRTQKESERVRGTHFLETADGETCQSTGSNRPGEGHAPTGDDRGRDF